MSKKADVVIIGGGITGCAILYQLAKYDLKCVLLEKEPDIAAGTTKANSAILHAGFDAKPGSLKAKMNVKGNALYHDLKDELDLDIKWTGSVVAATTEVEMTTVKELLERGRGNGVTGLEIWDGDKIREHYPTLSPDIKGGLWAPTAGICCPFGTAIAFAENAVMNGAEIYRDCGVTSFNISDGRIVSVETAKGCFKAKVFINAAGLRADDIARLAGDDSFNIKPRKGEYILFDKSAAQQMTDGIIFPAPSKNSKGILVCATFDGNVFIGPDANDQDDKENTKVTYEGMDGLMAAARKLLPEIPIRSAITEFAGLRAVSDNGDFILGKSDKVPNLVHAAGIQSPGLTSAPAIGEYIADIVVKELEAEPNTDYVSGRPARNVFHTADNAQRAAMIAKNPLYGRVICRCETITEGEIVDAIKRPCGATTVDGVKRRTRAGMGRCQGGFCGPKVIHILARELHIPVSEVRKDRLDGVMYYDKDWKDGGNV